MWQLIKRDYSIISFFIVFALLFKLAMFVFTAVSFFSSDNIYFFSFVLMMLYALLFYFDHSSNVMRTIVSLPIKKRCIIMSRYISLYTIGLIILTFAFIIDYSLEHQMFHFINVYFALCALTIYIAISTPVYYLFKRLLIIIATLYFFIIFISLCFSFFFIDFFYWFIPFLNMSFAIIVFQHFVLFLSLFLL